MAYNLTPFIASKVLQKVHVVSDYMGLTILINKKVSHNVLNELKKLQKNIQKMQRV